MNSNQISAVVCLAALTAALAAPSVALADDTPAHVDPSQSTMIIYPMQSQSYGQEGTVRVAVQVSAAGKPSEARLLNSSGYPDLDNAAIQTALNWHYIPATQDGQPQSGWLQVQVVYKLPPDHQASATQ